MKKKWWKGIDVMCVSLCQKGAMSEKQMGKR